MLRKKTLFSTIIACVCAIIMGFGFLMMPKAVTMVNAEQTTIERTELFDSENVTYDNEYGARFTGTGKINGVFKDTASITYCAEGQQTNMALTVCSTDGKEIVTLVRANKGANWNISLYTYYNGIFSWNENGTMTTSTTKWTDSADLPDGGVYGGVYTATLTLSGNIFTIRHTLVNNNEWTIAEFALTQEDAETLAQGFTIGVRTLDSSNPSDIVHWGSTRHLDIRAINEASTCVETITVDASTTVYYVGEQSVNGENVITLDYGVGLNVFTKVAQYTLDSLTMMGDGEELTYADKDFATAAAGTYLIEVGGKAYKVIVVEPLSMAREDLFASTNATYENDGVKITGVDKVNGVFKDTASVYYGTDSQQTNMALTICSVDGEEIVTVVRAGRGQNWDVSLYAYYDGVYSWNESGAMNTSTEKWTDLTQLPTGVNYNTQDNTIMFTLTGNQFNIQHTLVNNNVWTIADFTLTEADAAKLAEGFTVGFRTLDAQKASDVDTYWNTGHIYIKAVNNVSVANELIFVDTQIQNVSYDGEEVVDHKYMITLAYGENLKSFTKSTLYTIGSLTATVIQEVAVTADISEVGTYYITVEDKEYEIVVQTPIDAVDFEMAYGASIREGTINGGYGLRFIATIPTADYEYLMAQVGNYYSSISFGMIILPEDYVQVNGALTIEQFYGEDAIYDWAIDGVYTESAKTRIINLSDLTVAYNEKYTAYTYYGAITDVKGYNLQRGFVGAGYVKYVMADGEVGYKLFDYYENDIANNTRSIYQVAQLAVNSGDLSDTAETWFTDNVLNGVTYTVQYYTVENGVTTMQEELTLYGLVDSNAFAPARTYEGYTFDQNYEGSVLQGVLSVTTPTVLKFYFIKEV